MVTKCFLKTSNTKVYY